MGGTEPFRFRVGVRTDVFAYVPPHLDKGIGISAKVFMLQTGLVKQ